MDSERAGKGPGTEILLLAFSAVRPKRDNRYIFAPDGSSEEIWEFKNQEQKDKIERKEPHKLSW